MQSVKKEKVAVLVQQNLNHVAMLAGLSKIAGNIPYLGFRDRIAY